MSTPGDARLGNTAVMRVDACNFLSRTFGRGLVARGTSEDDTPRGAGYSLLPELIEDVDLDICTVRTW